MDIRVRFLDMRRRLRRGPYSRPVARKRNDLSIAVPFGYDSSPAEPAGKIAVIIHIFHSDTAGEFRQVCANIPGEPDILISTDEPTKADVILRAFSDWPPDRIRIKLVANRGRDMLSKFVAFREEMRGYALMLFLHSKKSTHLEAGRHDWRGTLLSAMIGSRATVASILAMFAEDARLGIVFPQHYEGIRQWISWGENRRQADRLAQRMGIDLGRARALDFISGSMFWARPAALEPIFALELAEQDFPPEQGQIDGTLAHALERLILYAAERAGFGWLKVAHPPCYSDRSGIIPIGSSAALGDAMRQARFQLLR